MPSPKLRGETAEMAFLLVAANLGLRVSKPFGDSFPYDFIVDNGLNCWRVQIKSSQKKGSNGLYQIHSGRTLNRHSKSYAQSEVDFMVFFIFREATWYIVPLAAIRERLAVTLYAPNRRTEGLYAEYYEAWSLLLRHRPCTLCTHPGQM